ncbi:Cu(I)-responsive transcriptional regulator [Limimaricola hongkongensis]|uniref:Cu(I)-responsive transcriptional regulator n=1 Tax=Limimaricola hongkongensis DSM 17492 TaxID=1122180 RepID=A0A017HEY4_9RHOB|nr:Cu(I)-responsive transcriptional regulator [Limimaricola hongkongensis]EYD72359.1 Cu(I)-responsive transcriptional regulator [Limimaricola hongkongensis DSM 17492]
MNIGEAATRAGLPAKTIRYYEEIGLVAPPRDGNGYRRFGEREVHKLAFLARARSLGFSIEDCRVLLSLYEDRDRASAEVRRLAQRHAEEIEARIDRLQQMRATLGDLIESCAGDDRPDCPILKDLAGK